jgi:hypothetical protein
MYSNADSDVCCAEQQDQLQKEKNAAFLALGYVLQA